MVDYSLMSLLAAKKRNVQHLDQLAPRKAARRRQSAFRRAVATPKLAA
jgi:hypothetical protein